MQNRAMQRAVNECYEEGGGSIIYTSTVNIPRNRKQAGDRKVQKRDSNSGHVMTSMFWNSLTRKLLSQTLDLPTSQGQSECRQSLFKRGNSNSVSFRECAFLAGSAANS